MRIHLIICLCLLSVAQACAGESPIYKNQFLASSLTGSLAIVAEPVEELKSSKTVLPLLTNNTLPFKRRTKCIVAIAHRDPEQEGTETFVGVQLIKVFRGGGIQDAIFVSRNEGWFGRDNLSPMTKETVNIINTKNMADFAHAHENRQNMDMLTYGSDNRKIATAWHARLKKTTDADYSANEQHLNFWHTNPLTETIFNEAHTDLLKNKPAFRIENRLMKFTVTSSSNPVYMPTFNFECNHPSLALIAIRIYLPLSADTNWTYLKME